MNLPTFNTTWDLESLFKGGSQSNDFISYLHDTQLKVEQLNQMTLKWPLSFKVEDVSLLIEIINSMSTIIIKLEQANSFVGCLQAQNTADKEANLLRSRVTSLNTEFSKVVVKIDQLLGDIDEDTWKQVLKKSEIKELTYIVNEMRNQSKEKLSVEKEQLIQELSVDGYIGWEQLYDLLVSNVQIPYNDNGVEKVLSVGQASNKFSDSNRELRKEMYDKWEIAWGNQSDVFAETLNRLSGFRLSVYKERGWNNTLKEPLAINRMNKETLDTMWQVIAENKQPLVDYLNRKAKLLGLEKLSWYDLEAPLAKADSVMTYQEGAEFILKQFSQFGPQLTAFTKEAFEKQWIEAEDRPNKAPGGFCTGLPETNESRIFMTYSGTPSNLSTLAHELGHAFHSYAMKDVHPLNSDYAMNVAETASTFAEMIVADAALKQATNHDERLALLDDKLQRSVAMLMNIHSRFLFETAFYEERKHGYVSSEKLSTLMLNAQKEGYSDSLEDYHPLFWASKLHFFITDVPFYNFPYTFGYLFSLGIYANALEEGKEFEQKYIDLLKDTGSMTVEDLAMKHLSVDLTKKEFWEKAVNMATSDVEEFIKLTNK
ncbi:M3 family oligoendopeptidase [Metabacillus litoralis]|uniref:M3 family oligoendopeptidase n=1 Tax=Metabacillus litoralis TaxID=152268 RepID=UPI001CFD08C0|nr:M3 family oligoendopeptidase [Metabacillus litoralis]